MVDLVIPVPTVPSATAPTVDVTFQAVEGGPETMSGARLLVEAYVVLWVILMGWLFFMARRQAVLHARIDGLEKALERAASKAAAVGDAP